MIGKKGKESGFIVFIFFYNHKNYNKTIHTQKIIIINFIHVICLFVKFWMEIFFIEFKKNKNKIKQIFGWQKILYINKHVKIHMSQDKDRTNRVFKC